MSNNHRNSPLVFSFAPGDASALRKYNIVYDPIGAHVDQVLQFITQREKTEPLEFVKRYLGYPSYEVPVSVSTNAETWKKERDVYLSELRREDSVLVQLRSAQQFNTPMLLIDLKRDEIKALLENFYTMDVGFDLMEKMDLRRLMDQYHKDEYAFLRRPELPGELKRLGALRAKLDEYMKLNLQATSKSIKAHYRFVLEANKIQDFRIKLTRAGILF